MGCCSEEAGLFKAQQAEVREMPTEEYNAICRKFQKPALDLAKLLTSQENHPPIYFYWFCRSIPNLGPWHALDMAYMFSTLHRTNHKIYQEDIDLTNAMNSYWAHFARMGNPNGEELPTWTEFSDHIPYAMELGDRIGMMEGELPIK